MIVSNNGLELLKRFEGLKLRAYPDIAGVWTIGYGHTIGIEIDGIFYETVKDAVEALGEFEISEEFADQLFRETLKHFENAVNRLVNITLTQNQFDALVSFVYNIGVEGFRSSTVRKRLNEIPADITGAAEAFSLWNNATIDGVLRPVKGLTRRRAEEAELFLTSVEPVLAPLPNEECEVCEPGKSAEPIVDPTVEHKTVSSFALSVITRKDVHALSSFVSAVSLLCIACIYTIKSAF